MAGPQGAQPRASQCTWDARFASGLHPGWLRARAAPGAGASRYRLTGQALRLLRNLGPLPAFGGWSFDRFKFQPFGCMGRSRTCDRPLAGLLYQTELPVVTRLESNQIHPFGWATTAVPWSSVCGVRHAGNRQSHETPDSQHRWGEPGFQPRPVSGRRLHWIPSLLPDLCQHGYAWIKYF